jgi:hypothetical protein
MIKMFVGLLSFIGSISLVGCTDSSCEISTQSGSEIVDNRADSSNNRSCSIHADCSSDECVPTILHEEGSVGICWSAEFEGCALVDFPEWVIVDMCNDRELVVCQLKLTPEMTAQCAPPIGGNAPWIANFLCCNPSFL